MLDLCDKSVIIIDYTYTINVDLTSNPIAVASEDFSPAVLNSNDAVMRRLFMELSIIHFSNSFPCKE